MGESLKTLKKVFPNNYIQIEQELRNNSRDEHTYIRLYRQKLICINPAYHRVFAKKQIKKYVGFMSKEIEAEIYRYIKSKNDTVWSLKFILDYKERVHFICSNLQITKNHINKTDEYILFHYNGLMELRNNILNKVIHVKQLVRMSPEEIRPDIWSRKEETFDKNMRQLFGIGVVVEKTEGMFECKSCYHKKCTVCKSLNYKYTTHYQIQTRSGDESMTVFVTCTCCGKRYKTS